MEKPKKNACGCFSFLRSRVKKPVDRSLTIQTVHRHNPDDFLLDRPKDLNSSMDPSLGTTQKLFSPANFYRSTIMAPSCRTPQVHNIPKPNGFVFPGKVQNTPKASQGTFSQLFSSVEMCRSRYLRKEIKEKVLFEEEGFKKSEIIEEKDEKEMKKVGNSEKERIEVEGFKEEMKKEEIREKGKFEEGSFKEEMKKGEIREKMIFEEGSYKEEMKKGEIREKFVFEEEGVNKEIKKQEIKEEKFCELVFSPDLEVLGGTDLEKNLPMLEISPIKSIVSVDDYSDIVNAFNYPHISTRLTIPDLFIRNKLRMRPLPLLKPSTPRFLSKQTAMPKLRKDNQILIEKMTYK